VVGVLSVVVMAASIYSVRFIQQSFLPSIDRGQFTIAMELPAGTPLVVTEREAIKVEEIIRSHPQVEAVFTTIGETSNAGAVEYLVTVVGGVEGGASSRAIIEQLRVPLAKAPQVSFQVADNVTGGDQLLGSRDIVIEMKGRGGTYEELGRVGDEMIAQLQQIPGLADIESSYKPGQPEVQVIVDRKRAADLGLSAAQVGSTVRTLVRGESATTFRGEGAEADIVVKMDDADIASTEDILDIKLAAPTGRLIPLRSVATTEPTSGSTRIQRVNREPTISIGINVSGRDVPDAVEDVTAFLAEVELPPDVEAVLGGDAEAQRDAFGNLSAALLLSVIFIYMVLASQFGSFVQPILIMLAMPLSVVGAIMALSLTGRPLDMTAFIGFIMLMGLVTKNSILLVDFANRARANGATADEAMRIAGPVRLRPILMLSLIHI